MIEKALVYAIEKILSYGKKNNCSDIHLSSGMVPMLRIDGDMVPIPNINPLSPKQVGDMIHSIMTDAQKTIFSNNLELDFSIQIEGDLRFRVNAFNTINGPSAVFREIPVSIKTLKEINAPDIMYKLAGLKKGLVLVVGPTGSGKSTTLAGFIDYINDNYNYHILTIEDPVEFIHKNKKSLINQREVGNSTKSFANALKSSLREDPNVILVGELRDIETIHLALTAAETGHLVLGTLHTSSAAQTINRIIDVFKAEDKPIIRTMLSSSIKAVISQRLLKKKGGGRVAAYEVMVANNSVRNLIREDKIPQINSLIELGKKEGMITMKEYVSGLVASDVISKEVADTIVIE